MRVFLDDVRPTPEGWERCYTPEEVIDLLRSGRVTRISLDHDLGLLDQKREVTGYDVVTWIEQAVANEGFAPPARIRVHSANVSAAPKMERGIESIRRLAARRNEDP